VIVENSTTAAQMFALRIGFSLAKFIAVAEWSARIRSKVQIYPPTNG
jgi:hypothetical protein